MMKLRNQIILAQDSAHPIISDISVVNPNSPTVVFVHGFKGFKDWGCWSLVETTFNQAGFNFIKFNFSKNGTSPDDLTNFVNLENFSENTLSRQINELKLVLDYLDHSADINNHDYYLAGHSMGGGISIITSHEDSRVKKLATWASVAEMDKVFAGFDLKKWESDRVVYIENKRTQQQMPLKYLLYEDYSNNLKRFDLLRTMSQLTIPTIIIHGESDATVMMSSAEKLYEHLNSPLKSLQLISGDHSFNGKHPWDEPNLPSQLQKVCDLTIDFFKSK